MSTGGTRGGGLILRSWKGGLGRGRRRLCWCTRIIRRGTLRGRGRGRGLRRFGGGMGWRWLWMRCFWIIRLGRDGDVAEMLLGECGVVVHPGSFYGIAESGRVVVSLLGLEQEFAEGLERIVHGRKLNHGS